MNGLNANNGDKEVFIPYKSIDRIVIQPNEVYGELDVKWYKKILSTPTGYIETGKWDLLIETIGGSKNRIVFKTKQGALDRLEEIKSSESYDVIINKVTIKE